MKEFIFPVSEESYGDDYKWNLHNNGELVRCKECEYYDRFRNQNIGTCRNIEIPNRTIEENWFCADGRRKNDG